MNSKHTPGPWKAVNNDAGTAFEIWNDDSQWVAYVQPQEPPEVEHANAALIAAAPDLLAALRVAIESLQTEGARAYDSTNKLATAHIDRAVEAARAAIAKAEGRQ